MNKPLATPTFAKYDPATALACLFRPVCRGKRPALKVDYQFDGLRLRFFGHEVPDVLDQSILLAAIGLAGLSSQPLDQSAGGSIGKQLWLDLQPTEKAIFDTATVVTCSYYQLLQAAGIKPDGRSYLRLKEEILIRLSCISCIADKDGYSWSMRLLSYSLKPDGTLCIAMNSRFASALAGQHVRVNLEERRQLGQKQKGAEVAELLHCYLTAWIRDGHSQKIGVDKLSAKIYGNESKNYDTGRTRRDAIIKALQLIGLLDGWQMQIDGIGMRSVVTIKRGKHTDAKNTSSQIFVD